MSVSRLSGASAEAATAPPLRRAPMPLQRWFGLWRGLLFALWPGLGCPAAVADTPPWQAAATRRRRVLLALVALLAGTALALQWPHAGAAPDAAGRLQALLLMLLFAWVGAGFATALMGAWVLLRGDRHALALRDAHAPIARAARTALVMPICNEDVATVFAGLRATCESLAGTGALSLFDIYVLSDTSDPALRAAEQRAWQRLRRTLGDAAVGEGGRVFYRWRRRRTRRKAGNVGDFCRRWGRNYRYMVVLDADSIMHGDTLVALVRLMEQQPRIGLVQTLPQGFGHGTVHARLQQFSNRVTGRLFALGMAYWQLGESHYWGHNAILRVEPFMRHCGLGPLPGRGGLAGEILSHDFVEAALMRRAGWEVWLAPQLGGSWEQHPPNLLEELQRDRRWCQGNLQNARLLAEPGWRPAHRAMLATGALSYLVAPLWLGFIVLGLGFSTLAATSPWLWGLTLTLLLLPRLLGVLAVQWRGEQAAFGGSLRLWGSALLDLLLSALQAPLRMLAHSVFVLGALSGLRLGWKSPAREAAAVAWRDAWSRIGALALPALLLVLALLWLDRLPLTAPHLLPLWLPLLLAVPFTVWSGGARPGLRLQRAGLLTVPEERRLPTTLQRGLHKAGFSDLAPAPAAALRQRPPLTGRRGRALLALAGTALATLMLLPRTALSPELSPELSPVLQAPWAQWARLGQSRLTPPAVSAPRPQALPPLQVALTQPAFRPARYRPASRIDDELRRRAYRAVARSLAEQSS
ncbi:MAG TPA: glucans biosynthesis glucosyltransferase MdoH [Rubrivivax sp.]|nr:glucans biosynthesis glucosyltransferase MdoH [Rubrivivax sp.]